MLHILQEGGGGNGTTADLDVTETVVKPWLNNVFADDNYGAHGQEDQGGAKLAESWPTTMSPPPSLDLRSLDYAIAGKVEWRVCRVPHKNVDDLKASIERSPYHQSLSSNLARPSSAELRPPLLWMAVTSRNEM